MLDTDRIQPRLDQCWVSKATPPCFVLPGRYGDIIQILPCWLEIYRRTGNRPHVIVSREFASVLDGVSYVIPIVINETYYPAMTKARNLAEKLCMNAIVPRWWLDDPEHAAMVAESAKGDFVIQCHGQGWGVDIAKWPDYGTSMASRCGFTLEEWKELPLVFDRRDYTREKKLADYIMRGDKRPVVLYNFTAISAPFGYAGEMFRALKNSFGNTFRFIDLGSVTAYRLYDLLGLYDLAVGMMTVDTATLHLAPATRIPYVAFTVDGWRSSVPKGNCVLHVKYSKAWEQISRTMEKIAAWRPA